MDTRSIPDQNQFPRYLTKQMFQKAHYRLPGETALSDLSDQFALHRNRTGNSKDVHTCMASSKRASDQSAPPFAPHTEAYTILPHLQTLSSSLRLQPFFGTKTSNRF